MNGKVTKAGFEEALSLLQKEYHIFAPKRYEGKGRFSDTDLIRYGEISHADEIIWDEKSFYSPKEIVFPITQTIFYFTEEDFKVPKAPYSDKPVLIFLRPCDINGIKRLDKIYLSNGKDPDLYYKRIRERIKFAMIECTTGFDSCFCVSMKSSETDDYAMAVRFGKEKLMIKIKDDDISSSIGHLLEKAPFEPEFVKENKLKINLPEVDEMPQEMYEHEIWREYDSRCIACGRCNTTCITCSCFDTHDIFSDDNPQTGERRRVWACCHVDGFSDIAGGHSFRKRNGDKMRFKTFHKIYDYKKRFGDTHMCVGCGRCDDSCPEYISYANCINKVTETIRKLKGGKENV
jgi:anaerobic sulfite reductase subunit A